MMKFRTEQREADSRYEVMHALMGIGPLVFNSEEQAELVRTALGQAYHEGAEETRAAIRSVLGAAKDR